jgi:hypothetical protein
MPEVKQQQSVAPNEQTVWLVRPSVYPMIFEQDREAPKLEQQHRMNRRHS